MTINKKEQFIIDNYTKLTDNQMANILDVTYSFVRKIIKKHEIKRERSFLWTKERIDFLINNIDYMSIKDISISLKTGYVTVIKKTKELSLKSIYGRYPVQIRDAYRNIKDRCYNQNNKRYSDYGGRGIIISEEWKNFKDFAEWSVNNGWKNNLTIDRIDVNGNYCPENCRWITNLEQQKNKRTNVLLTAFGETKNIKDWSDDIRCQISESTLSSRISKGWEHEKAITTGKNTFVYIKCFGEIKPIIEWFKDKRCKCRSYILLRARIIDRNIPPEIAMCNP